MRKIQSIIWIEIYMSWTKEIKINTKMMNKYFIYFSRKLCHHFKNNINNNSCRRNESVEKIAHAMRLIRYKYRYVWIYIYILSLNPYITHRWDRDRVHNNELPVYQDQLVQQHEMVIQVYVCLHTIYWYCNCQRLYIINVLNFLTKRW